MSLPARRMCWNKENNRLFKAQNYGEVIAERRFEEILENLQDSHKDGFDQVLDLIEQVNATFQNAMSPGDTLCVDESMVKTFHKLLVGKVKIKRKPQPTGNEFKMLLW